MIYLKMVFDNIDQPCASILVAWTWVLIFYFAKMRFWWPCCTHQRHLSKDCSLYFPLPCTSKRCLKTFSHSDIWPWISLANFLMSWPRTCIVFWPFLKPIKDHLVEYGKYFKRTWGISFECNSEKIYKTSDKKNVFSSETGEGHFQVGKLFVRVWDTFSPTLHNLSALQIHFAIWTFLAI